MSILNKLRNSLETFNYKVCYGKCFDPENDWNVIIYKRLSFRKKNKDYITQYEVTICQENYIQEGLAEKIIKKVTEDTKLKLLNNEMPFYYLRRGESKDVIETLTLTFVWIDKCQM